METFFGIIGFGAMAVLLWGGLAMISFKTSDVMQGIDDAHREREADLLDDRGDVLPGKSKEYDRIQKQHREHTKNADMLGVYAIVGFIVLFMIVASSIS